MDKDPLFGNKLACAVLVSLLMLFGLPLMAHSFFSEGHGGAHHGDDHAHPFPHYPVEVAIAGTAAPEKEVPDLGAMMASMSPSQGERNAGLCKSCHTFEQGGSHGQGPNLWNIVNRPVGSISDFSGYSSALKADGGVWSYDRLDAYIENSKAYIPGTAMAQRIRKAEKRAAILVYLSTLSDNPVPFPAPLQKEIENTLGAEEAGE